MEIIKVINKNAVSVSDGDRELVLVGEDIGLAKKSGMETEAGTGYREFVIDNPDFGNKFRQMIEHTQLEYIELCTDVIDYAREELNLELNEYVYITLTDHISFAIDRKNEGIVLKNALLDEIKSFYPEEFRVGKYAVDYIREKTGLEFNDDEAGFIALHFVNAEFEKTGSNLALGMTDLVKNSLNIIEKNLDLNIESNSFFYDRMITHLKFLAHRIYNNEHYEDNQDETARELKRKKPEIYRVSEMIREYIFDRFDIEISTAECVYLTIHISRIVDQLKKEKEND